MTVVAAFCPLSLQTLFNLNACPIKGGRLFFYDAETTNPRTVYQDAGLALPHPFPVRTNAYGRIPPIWVGVGNYKVVLKDAVDALISSIDDLPGGIDETATVAPTVPVQTGMVIAGHGTALYDGWLPLNANTIGNANSAATGRANDDANALFVYLWNQDASLPVSGGRGITASADWSAAKTITLPDYRGRSIFGVDGMGAPTSAGIITTATTATPNVIGTAIGSESEVLSIAQLPTFTPAVTIAAAGGFTPAGTIANAGAHNHTGSTGSAGGHNHTYTGANNVGTVTNGTGNPYAAQVNGAATSSVPDHVHAIQTDGDHTHAFTGTAQPDHTHTATADAIGSGSAHQNIPPGVLAYWHIKL